MDGSRWAAAKPGASSGLAWHTGSLPFTSCRSGMSDLAGPHQRLQPIVRVRPRVWVRSGGLTKMTTGERPVGRWPQVWIVGRRAMPTCVC